MSSSHDALLGVVEESIGGWIFEKVFGKAGLSPTVV
jgi:hypothetical protein